MDAPTQPSRITVAEQFDRHGDLVYVLHVQTYSRRAVDELARVMDADVQWPIAADELVVDADFEADPWSRRVGPSSQTLRARAVELAAMPGPQLQLVGGGAA